MPSAIGDVLKDVKVILHKMDEKIDRLDITTAKIEVIMEHNTASLQEHVKRTNLLQEQVKHIDDRVRHWEIVLKVMGVLLALAGTIAGIWGVMK